MAVKGLWEGRFGGRLGVGGPRTPKLPRAPRNGDPALPTMFGFPWKKEGNERRNLGKLE